MSNSQQLNSYPLTQYLPRNRICPMVERGPKPKEDPFPLRIEPMLPKTTKELPRNHAEWIGEFRWRGLPVIAYLHPKKGIRLITKTDTKNVSSNFQALTDSLLNLSREHTMIIDGEIVFNGGVTARDQNIVNFQARHSPLDSKSFNTRPFRLIAYDLLYLDGQKLLDEDLAKRKKLLKKALPKRTSNKFNIIPNYFSPEVGPFMVDYARSSGHPALYVRRAASKYSPGSTNNNWLQIRTAA